jgi:maltose alpha-D-glucosyltransferase/alpha-amylase
MLQAGDRQWLLALVDTQGPAERASYFLPLSVAFEDQDEDRHRALAAVAVTKVRQQATMGLLGDAMADEPFCRALVEAIGAGRTLKGSGGELRFTPSARFAQIVGDSLSGPTPLQRLTTSSNSISLLGDRLFLKAYRRLQPGVSPELEMGRHLTDVVGFEHCVPVAGSLEFRSEDGEVSTLALLQANVPHQGDAWDFCVGQLVRVLEAHLLAGDGPTADTGLMIERARVLARRVAELHLALARVTGDPAFDPEPVHSADLAAWSASAAGECRRTLAQLAQPHADWPETLRTLAAGVLAAGATLVSRIEQLAQASPAGLKTRLHGDLHLQQVLIQRDDFLIIDFEGEPSRPLAQRRAKHSALRDVAGMLRSFDYARHTALHKTAQGTTELARLAAPARQWERDVRAAFMASYREGVVTGGLYADDEAFAAAQPILDMFELEKALYELRYELGNRPDWVGVPLAGIATLAGLSP